MILPKGNRSKIDNKMGKFILKNYPKISSPKLAIKFKTSHVVICRFLKLNSIKIANKGYHAKGKQSPHRKLPNLNTLKSDYFIKKLNTYQIAKKYKCNVTAVCAEFRRNKISLNKIQWTKDKIIKEALKYKYKKDFEKLSRGAYKASIRLNIYHKVCSHMKTQGTLYKRFVYIYQFSDNSIYVGITLNKKKRHLQHKSNGIVRNRKMVTYKVSKLLPSQDALVLEQKMVDLFKKNNYVVLNKNKCYSLGSVKKFWTKEKILETAKSCKTRTEFWTKYTQAARMATKFKFYKEAISHMSADCRFRKIIKIQNGQTYNGITEAAKLNKIPKSTLYKALFLNRKTNNSYWEYVK